MEITPRLIAAVVVFLLGTTFLWLTSAFVGGGAKAEGTIWTAVQVLALATVVGFAVAAYGLWQGTLPREPIAAISAIIGLLATAAYWVAVRDVPAAENVLPNLVIHAVIGLGVLAVAYLPIAHDWVVTQLR